MTYVVTDACIRGKYMDCVEGCPTDAFHEGENMLVIDPGACIDCHICVPECPADAILPDTDKAAEQWLELNATYADRWPNITSRGNPPADADAYKGEDGKLAKYFSPEPGGWLSADSEEGTL